MCRDTFLSIIRHHNPKLAAKVDVVFALSSAWVMTESDSDFEMLEKRLSDLNPDELILVSIVHTCTCQDKHLILNTVPGWASHTVNLLQVSSAFSQMLNLHNLSEDISNAQSERAARMGEVNFVVHDVLLVNFTWSRQQ